MPELSIEELVRWSAEGLCGWHKRPQCVNITGGIEYSKDVWVDQSGKIMVFADEWAPHDSNSPAWQILAVIEKIKQRELTICLRNFQSLENFGDPRPVIGKTYTAEIMDWDRDEFIGEETNENPFIAILRAAHAAWKHE